MKALLALAIIYIGTFFFVSQGISQSPAAESGAAPDSPGTKPVGPAPAGSGTGKQTDLRTLLERIGAKEAIEEAGAVWAAPIRERLLESLPPGEQRQRFVESFTASYRKRLEAGAVGEELARIYDQRFTEEEIKGLLQFYGSPLGQKFASELPKISSEVQALTRAASRKAGVEALAEAKQQNLGVGQTARIGNLPPR